MALSAWVRVLFLALFINAHQSVLRLINKVVPESYLDEVFHIPQAQRYWQGKWTEWDPKITTPPGVYLWSYVFNTIRGGRGNDLSVEDLRFSNAVLLYVLVVGLTLWTTVARRQADPSAVLQKEFVIVAFPLLFFFSGLYYTDLFSALTVVFSYVAWEAGARYRRRRWIFQILHFAAGLLSLASRQTNVFWVGVFLAGLQVVESVKDRVGSTKVHDPDVGSAWFEDYLKFIISIIQNIFSALPYLIVDLWPQLALLISFAGFVVWNNGVVLGDKQNHVATIHTPQLLYIWPMMVFFSWPVILSSLAAQLQPLTMTSVRTRLPRLWVVGLVTAIMATSVHFNTIVHPFTLADNRHYTFYIFRILMRPLWVKYAAVPVYFTCAWLVITALGQPELTPTSSHKSSADSSSSKKQEVTVQTEEKNNTPLSFVVIWFVSTALSLMTAPLVEPRYFIVPWLIWRLYIPDPSSSNNSITRQDSHIQPKTLSKHGKDTKAIAAKDSPATAAAQVSVRSQRFVTCYALWFELAWYTIVNAITIYIFLQWGFQWPSEPGLIQRFMW